MIVIMTDIPPASAEVTELSPKPGREERSVPAKIAKTAISPTITKPTIERNLAHFAVSERNLVDSSSISSLNMVVSFCSIQLVFLMRDKYNVQMLLSKLLK